MDTLKPAFETFIIPSGYILVVTEQEVLKNFSKKDLAGYMDVITKGMDTAVDPVMAKIMEDLSDEPAKQAHCNENVFFCKNWVDVVNKMTEYIPSVTKTK